MKLPKWVHKKSAKGRTYLYFNTGLKTDTGKPLLTPLPSIRDPRFGGAYARAVAARTNRDRKDGLLTLDGLIFKFEKSPEFAVLSPSTKKSYHRYLGRASQLMRTKTGQSTPAAAIEGRDVTAMRDALSATPGAASQAVRAIGALYAWAKMPGQALVTINPANLVTIFKGNEHQPWPEDLIEDALADPQIDVAVALLYFTGQRINEVVKMTWNDIQSDHMRVYVQKTKQRILVALLPELRSLLDQVRWTRPTAATTILVNSNGQPWTQGGLRQKLQAWAKERGHHVVPHGLRKNAVNSLYEAGCSSAEVSGITDQSITMLEHYAKGRNKLRLGQAAVAKLDSARRARNEART